MARWRRAKGFCRRPVQNVAVGAGPKIDSNFIGLARNVSWPWMSGYWIAGTRSAKARIMKIGNAFGFIFYGVLMGLLPAVAPTWFPPTAIDGSSGRALWLE